MLKFNVACAMTTHFCKAGEELDTGNPFRSSDLGVMSPQSETARFPCAMPVYKLYSAQV